MLNTIDRVRTLLPITIDTGIGSPELAAAVGRLMRFQVAAEDDPVAADTLNQIDSVLRIAIGDHLMGWQSSRDDLLATMRTLSRQALETAWDGEVPPEDQAEDLVSGGTIEAADRAYLLTSADDLLSIAYLYETVTPELLREARMLRQRVWVGCASIVRARLATWVEQQATERWLGLDPVAAFLWAPPDVILPA